MADKEWSTSDILELLGEGFRPKFRAGARFEYNDTGFLLLSLVIEQAVGKPFHAALHDMITAPLQMRQTPMAFVEPDVGGLPDLHR